MRRNTPEEAHAYARATAGWDSCTLGRRVLLKLPRGIQNIDLQHAERRGVALVFDPFQVPEVGQWIFETGLEAFFTQSASTFWLRNPYRLYAPATAVGTQQAARQQQRPAINLFGSSSNDNLFGNSNNNNNDNGAHYDPNNEMHRSGPLAWVVFKDLTHQVKAAVVPAGRCHRRANHADDAPVAAPPVESGEGGEHGHGAPVRGTERTNSRPVTRARAAARNRTRAYMHFSGKRDYASSQNNIVTMANMADPAAFEREFERELRSIFGRIQYDTAVGADDGFSFHEIEKMGPFRVR
ncbi:hypothetical protein B0T24DRAFT_594409 [Lasiosphaeria ovina]|uniref:Uncharacterized protein n=1 Tax=Lasiosphaeria ovina TaxID=92902 RepID=A0AAE0N856_9PEZI|nr:hypothetical protein B0T24DRAFT_594409 [Lasiosphaeria ovina]